MAFASQLTARIPTHAQPRTQRGRLCVQAATAVPAQVCAIVAMLLGDLLSVFAPGQTSYVADETSGCCVHSSMSIVRDTQNNLIHTHHAHSLRLSTLLVNVCLSRWTPAMR